MSQVLSCELNGFGGDVVGRVPVETSSIDAHGAGHGAGHASPDRHWIVTGSGMGIS
jgi:hypothetical protein